LHLVLMNKRGRRIRFVAASLLFFAVALAARATTIVVTNTNDSGPGSLRQALADANNGDTIVFAITGTIALTTGELLVGTSVTISATPGSMAVDGTNNSRVFHISSGTTVTISGLTIEQGNPPNHDGGGIYNDHAMLALNDCTIVNNAGTGGGDVRALVYVDAFAPDEGETVFQILGGSGSAFDIPDPTAVFDIVGYPGAPEGDAEAFLKPSTVHDDIGCVGDSARLIESLQRTRSNHAG